MHPLVRENIHKAYPREALLEALLRFVEEDLAVVDERSSHEGQLTTDCGASPPSCPDHRHRIRAQVLRRTTSPAPPVLAVGSVTPAGFRLNRWWLVSSGIASCFHLNLQNAKFRVQSSLHGDDGPAALLLVSSVQRLYESARLGITAAIISRAFRSFVQSVGGIGPAPAEDALHRLKSKAVAPPVLFLGPPELQLAHEAI